MSDDIETLRGFLRIFSHREDHLGDRAKDATFALERIATDRGSLRKALDDRYAADRKAAKAIFAETGRTAGFPSVKDVVAWYVAEVDRLEKEREVFVKGTLQISKENDSLRAKLDRAERDVALAKRREDISRKFWIRDAKEALAGKPQALRNRIELFESPENDARVVLSELSADAPAQQSDVGSVTLPGGGEAASSGGLSVGVAHGAGQISGMDEVIAETQSKIKDAFKDSPKLVAISAESMAQMREAMVEAEKALEPFADCIADDGQWVSQLDDYDRAPFVNSRAALAKLRSVMK